MSMRRLMNQEVLVQPVTVTTDAYGNSVRVDDGSPHVEQGFLGQKDTTEYQVDRQTVVTRWNAFLPADSVVTPLAYLTFGSQRFQVDGEPYHVWNPRTRTQSHVECLLTVIS